MNMLAKHNANLAAAGMPVSFNDLMKSFFGHYPEWNSAWLAERNQTGLQIEVHDKDVSVKLPFPGCTPKDFEVEVIGDFLTVKAQHSTQNNESENGRHYICRERSMESYQESVHLPVTVKGSETKAKYLDGVLTLTIPRETENAKTSRTIKVD